METATRRPLRAIKSSSRLAVAWLTMFIVGSDLFVVSPLLPLIAADYGTQPAVAGLTVTVFAVSYMLSAPFLGHLADRIGRERLLTYCLISFGAANLMSAVAGNLTELLAARVLAGTAAAGVSPSVYALVSGSAPSDRRATWLAIAVCGLLMSLSLGAPLGELIGAALGWPIVFAGLGMLSLLLVRANSWVWQGRQPAQNPPASAVPLTAAAVAVELAPTVVWSTAVYTMYTYLAGGLASFGYSTDEIAGVILFYGCGAVGGALLGGRMTDRFGAKPIGAIGLAGLGACFVLLHLALDDRVLVYWAFGILSAVAQLFFPAQQVRLARQFPARRATILAWNNSALFLGISFGSVIGGQATAFGGFDANLTISAAIAIAGWTLYVADRPWLADFSRPELPAATAQGGSHRSSGTPTAN